MGTEALNYWTWGALGVTVLLVTIGLIWWWKKRDPRALLVLSFEKIVFSPYPCSDKNQWYNPHKLKRQLLTLQQRGFSFITPAQLTHLPEKPIWLTFMGGYGSFYSEIFPFLQEHHIPATLFLVPDTVNHYNTWQDPYQEPWQDVLTSKELKVLQKSGLISFGAAPLEGKDISVVSQQDALFFISESITRCKEVLKLPIVATTLWPACGKHAAIASALQAATKLPLITLFPRVNSLPLSSPVLTAFLPKRHAFKTWKALHRQH